MNEETDRRTDSHIDIARQGAEARQKPILILVPKLRVFNRNTNFEINLHFISAVKLTIIRKQAVRLTYLLVVRPRAATICPRPYKW